MHFSQGKTAFFQEKPTLPSQNSQFSNQKPIFLIKTRLFISQKLGIFHSCCHTHNSDHPQIPPDVPVVLLLAIAITKSVELNVRISFFCRSIVFLPTNISCYSANFLVIFSIVELLFVVLYCRNVTKSMSKWILMKRRKKKRQQQRRIYCSWLTTHWKAAQHEGMKAVSHTMKQAKNASDKTPVSLKKVLRVRERVECMCELAQLWIKLWCNSLKAK